MSRTKRSRSRKAPASTAPTAAPTSRGGRLAFFATLAVCLATAIASAAWLIATQEYTAMTAITTPNAQAAPASAPAPTPVAQTTASADATASVTANAAQPATPQPSASSASSASSPSSAASAPSVPAAPSAAGQRAFIDPVTGQLRQPEHDELAAIAAEAAASGLARRSAAARTATAASAASEFYGPDGSVGAVVPEDLHTFTVATRGPDGRVVIEHAQGAKDAAGMMKANSAIKPQASVSRAQQKEARNDR